MSLLDRFRGEPGQDLWERNPTLDRPRPESVETVDPFLVCKYLIAEVLTPGQAAAAYADLYPDRHNHLVRARALSQQARAAAAGRPLRPFSDTYAAQAQAELARRAGVA